jgi:hypothetical protein
MLDLSYVFLIGCVFNYNLIDNIVSGYQVVGKLLGNFVLLGEVLAKAAEENFGSIVQGLE